MIYSTLALTPQTHQKASENIYSCFQHQRTAFGNTWVGSDFLSAFIILQALSQRQHFEHWTSRMMGQVFVLA